jgi:hypothetical protein
MSTFDAYLAKLAGYIEEMRGGGRQVREIACPVAVSGLLDGLPVRVGPGASSGIILQSDTFIELGNPDAGSCAFVLWTDNPSLVRDGRITLVGPDIQECREASLPFGQVLMVRGAGLGEQEHERLEQGQYVSGQIEGYMIRSMPQRMWSRVSREAAAKGFGLETLGRALMAIYKSEFPKVEALEVLFVTSSKEDVERLDGLASQVRHIGKNIVRENWLAKGIDILECTFGWDCSSCEYEPVCDDIRKLITVRKRKTGESETVANS